MICPECGFKNFQGHKFCAECGAPLPIKGKKDRKRGGGNGGRIVAVILCVLLLGGGAYLAARHFLGGATPAPTATQAVIPTPTRTAAPTPTKTTAPTPTRTTAPTPTRTTAPTATPDPKVVTISSIRDLSLTVWDMIDSEQEHAKLRMNGLKASDTLPYIVETIDQIDTYSWYEYDGIADITLIHSPGWRAYLAVKNGEVSSLDGDARRIAQKAQSVVGAVIKPGMTDLEKEQAIHDYIIAHCEYEINPDLNTASAIGFFDHGKCQCAGYSDTFLLLGRLAGLEVYTITGEADNGSGSGYEDHAWNLIRLNGLWYPLDVTWDESDDVNYYPYFNMPMATFGGDHRWNQDMLPPGQYASSLDGNYYYVWKGLMVGTEAEAIARGRAHVRDADGVWLASTNTAISTDRLTGGILDGMYDVTLWHGESGFDSDRLRIWHYYVTAQ